MQDKYLAKVRIRESWRGRRSENRMWSNEILEEDEKRRTTDTQDVLYGHLTTELTDKKVVDIFI